MTYSLKFLRPTVIKSTSKGMFHIGDSLNVLIETFHDERGIFSHFGQDPLRQPNNSK